MVTTLLDLFVNIINIIEFILPFNKHIFEMIIIFSLLKGDGEVKRRLILTISAVLLGVVSISLGVISAVKLLSDDDTNLALDKFVYVSTNESDELSGNKAVDGDRESEDSRWASKHYNDEWFVVDLGEVKSIDEVKIFWSDDYATEYKILVSENGANFTEVYNETNGRGGKVELNFPEVSGRYVKLQGISRNSEKGYSFYEFEVYE